MNGFDRWISHTSEGLRRVCALDVILAGQSSRGGRCSVMGMHSSLPFLRLVDSEVGEYLTLKSAPKTVRTIEGVDRVTRRGTPCLKISMLKLPPNYGNLASYLVNLEIKLEREVSSI